MAQFSAEYQAALAAVNRLFGNSRVPRATTISELEALREEMEVMLQALEEDERREQRKMEAADFGNRLYQPHPDERWQLLWGMSRAEAAWLLWKNRRQAKRLA